MGDYIKFSFNAEDEDGDKMNMNIDSETLEAINTIS